MPAPERPDSCPYGETDIPPSESTVQGEEPAQPSLANVIGIKPDAVMDRLRQMLEEPGADEAHIVEMLRRMENEGRRS